MLRTKRITELETVLSLQEEVVAQEVATFRALEAELASLKAGIASSGKIDSLPRTDAILNVLRSTAAMMTVQSSPPRSATRWHRN